MNLFQTSRIAARALRRNLMRSFLTALGIVIGVGAVIAMVAIGEGAKSQMQEQFNAMGSNLLIVMPGSSTSGGVQGGFGSQPTLTWEDLKALQTELATVRAAAPLLRTNASVISDDTNWATSINGTTPEYFTLRSWTASPGSAITWADVESASKVVVLGRTVADKLFAPGVDPTGSVVRIKNVPFTVTGVLAKKGQSPMGQDFDDTVFVPLSTFRARLQGGLGQYLNGNIFVGATPAAGTRRAQQQVAALLRDRHRLQQGVDDDFSIRNLEEVASAQQESTRTMTTLLASIALVSLLVGGIGIMNIMLVSVTERTREIGVRMAIGATPANILAQFLVEALTLSLVGGLVGVASGIIAAQQLAKSFGWPLLIRADIVGLSVGFSALVGVVFGLYPARKASQLDPIEALRFE